MCWRRLAPKRMFLEMRVVRRKYAWVLVAFLIGLVPGAVWATCVDGNYIVGGFDSGFGVTNDPSDCELFITRQSSNPSSSSSTPYSAFAAQQVVSGMIAIFSGSLCVATSIISSAMFKVYCSLVHQWTPIALALATLYVMLYFVALLFNINNTQVKDALPHMIKMAVVLSLVVKPDLFYEFVYSFFMGLMNGISFILIDTSKGLLSNHATITSAQGATSGWLEVMKYPDAIIDAIINPVELRGLFFVGAALLTVSFGFGQFTLLFLLLGAFGAIYAFARVMIMFTTSFMFASFNLMFGGIFMSFFLSDWGPLKRTAFAYLSSTFSYVAQVCLALICVFVISAAQVSNDFNIVKLMSFGYEVPETYRVVVINEDTGQEDYTSPIDAGFYDEPIVESRPYFLSYFLMTFETPDIPQMKRFCLRGPKPSERTLQVNGGPCQVKEGSNWVDGWMYPITHAANPSWQKNKLQISNDTIIFGPEEGDGVGALIFNKIMPPLLVWIFFSALTTLAFQKIPHFAKRLTSILSYKSQPVLGGGGATFSEMAGSGFQRTGHRQVFTIGSGISAAGGVADAALSKLLPGKFGQEYKSVRAGIEGMMDSGVKAAYEREKNRLRLAGYEDQVTKGENLDEAEQFAHAVLAVDSSNAHAYRLLRRIQAARGKEA